MVVVVYLDGDGDVEVDATVDATNHPCRPMHSTCSASNVSTSINEPSSSSPWSTTSSMACREAHADRADQLTKLLSEAQDERGGRLLEGVVAMLTKML